MNNNHVEQAIFCQPLQAALANFGTTDTDDYTYDILPSGSTGAYWANGILLGSTLRLHIARQHMRLGGDILGYFPTNKRHRRCSCSDQMTKR